MSRLLCLSLSLLAAFPALSQTRVTPEEYGALAAGRTLHYSHRGQPFGAEQYLGGNRTLWRFNTGACSSGKWFAEGQNVCFSYEGSPRTLCWAFLKSGEDMRAFLLPGPDTPEQEFALDLSHIDDEPLACPGPDVGM